MKTCPTNTSLIIFDLDGTLAESKAPLDSEMAGLLCRLLSHTRVAVISGASFKQLQVQFLWHLVKDQYCQPKKVNLKNLSILPTSGSSFYRYNTEKSEWQLVYEKKFAAEDKKKIKDAIAAVLNKMNFRGTDGTPEKIYGPQLEDRDSQMTFSALGQQAPINAKRMWDPDYVKRRAMVAALSPLLPGFQINLGGMTSIDITKKGMDKEHGIEELVRHLAIPKTDVVYVGDEVFPGGNDYGAVTAGVQTYAVNSVAETKAFIRTCIEGILKKK